MAIFRLSQELVFPPPRLAEPDGLLAVGGDLTPERILLAYSLGIFPWYSDSEPLLWWSPAPRLVLFPEEFHLPRRLGRTVRNGRFKLTMDTAFAEVITGCAMTNNRKESGTWITSDMIKAYILLHELGYAHSIETWLDGKLTGGLYGLCLDRIFFGESMFTEVTDASKVAFAALVAHAKGIANIKMIDCQMTTKHLLRFGAREISRNRFEAFLDTYIDQCKPQKKWRLS